MQARSSRSDCKNKNMQVKLFSRPIPVTIDCIKDMVRRTSGATQSFFRERKPSRTSWRKSCTPYNSTNLYAASFTTINLTVRSFRTSYAFTQFSAEKANIFTKWAPVSVGYSERAGHPLFEIFVPSSSPGKVHEPFGREWFLKHTSSLCIYLCIR